MRMILGFCAASFALVLVVAAHDPATGTLAWPDYMGWTLILTYVIAVPAFVYAIGPKRAHH